MYRLARTEQESIILFNAAEPIATVYTRDKVVMKQLDSLVSEFPDVYKCIKVTDIDKTYSMPKKYVSYRKPRKLSAEQRDAARERARHLNKG